jgi:hypothetical protein
MTMPISHLFCDENGYALYDRWGREDRIEVWRKADRKLVHVADSWLAAYQWAHSGPHGHLLAVLPSRSFH